VHDQHHQAKSYSSELEYRVAGWAMVVVVTVTTHMQDSINTNTTNTTY
jgi:hypothetical protein